MDSEKIINDIMNASRLLDVINGSGARGTHIHNMLGMRIVESPLVDVKTIKVRVKPNRGILVRRQVGSPSTEIILVGNNTAVMHPAVAEELRKMFSNAFSAFENKCFLGIDFPGDGIYGSLLWKK